MAIFKKFVVFMIFLPIIAYAMPGPDGEKGSTETDCVEEFLCCVALNGDAAKCPGLWEDLENSEDVVFSNYKLVKAGSDKEKKLLGVVSQISKCSVCFSYCWPLPSECGVCRNRVCKKCLKKNKKCAAGCQKSTAHHEGHTVENAFLLTAKMLESDPDEYISGECKACQQSTCLTQFVDHTKECYIKKLPFSQRTISLKGLELDDECKQIIAGAGLALIDDVLKCKDKKCGFKYEIGAFSEKYKMLSKISDDVVPLFMLHLNTHDRCHFIRRFGECFAKQTYAFFSFQVRMHSMKFEDLAKFYLEEELQVVKEKYKNEHKFSDAEEAELEANKFASTEMAKKFAHTGLFFQGENLRCLTCELTSVDISKGLEKKLCVAEIHAGSQPECKLVKHMYPPFLIKKAVEEWKKISGCTHRGPTAVFHFNAGTGSRGQAPMLNASLTSLLQMLGADN